MLHIRTSLFAFLTVFLVQHMHAAQIAQTKSVVENYAKLEEYTSQNDLDGAQKFIETIVDINAQALYTQETILMKAIKYGNRMGVKLLLARADIKVNSTNSDGETPLQIAMQECLYKISLATPDDIIETRHNIIKQLGAQGAVFDINKFRIVDSIAMMDNIPECALLKTYYDGLVQCDSIKKEYAAYEQAVAHQLNEHIPVKDLNNIMNEYAKMNIVDFALTHKQNELQNQQK